MSLRLEGVWNEERQRIESLDGLWWFDPQKPDDFSGFSREYLRGTKGEIADKPLVLLPWHEDLVVRPAFGWRSVEDGTRRFRKVVVFVPKKNAKSGLCSVVALFLTVADGEPGAEVYSAALNEHQARIVFDDAGVMVDRSPKLRAAAGVRRMANTITRQATNSKYEVLCGKPAANHGYNVHGLVLDELHTQRNRALVVALSKGVSNRRQPLIFYISTAGEDRQSIAYEEYEYAKAVLSGEHSDPRVLPVIFEMKEGDDWGSEEVWHRVNPGLGVTKQLSYMRDAYREARNEPRKRNEFLNLDLNKWTETREAWIPPESWAACERAAAVEPKDLRELVCTLGFDLSETMDLTAVVATFRRPDTRPPQEIEVESESALAGRARRVVAVDFSVYLKTWFFIPQEVYEARVREKKDSGNWALWKERGHLRTTPGPIVDYAVVRNVVLGEIMPKYRVARAGFDKHNARQLAPVLIEDGVPMEEVNQRVLTLSAASKLFEALIFARRLEHEGNLVMAWCVANAETFADRNGNIAPRKPGGDARSTRRIDGVSATVTALDRLMVVPAPPPPGSSRIRVLG